MESGILLLLGMFKTGANGLGRCWHFGAIPLELLTVDACNGSSFVGNKVQINNRGQQLDFLLTLASEGVAKLR